MMRNILTITLLAYLASISVLGQTFQRLGACPTLGCVFPPDQADFLPGQAFDIRLEVHAPVNGSEAFNGGVPDKAFTFTISFEGQKPIAAKDFFKKPEPGLETWTFTWFEDLFAQQSKTPTVVNVASKAFRQVALYKPGQYTATLSYFGGRQTVAHWTVREFSRKRIAKNVILFIGDGMTTSMQTAARLIAHKSINGKYQSLLQLDQMEALGHQMTHSIDSFITDSANSATALYSGHKSTVNSLNVYADSSPDPFDDPKFETVAELFRRIHNGKIGIVSTAFLADATPAAIIAHTRLRGLAPQIVDSYLHGNTNFSWTHWDGPDVLFGGGAENFFAGPTSFKGQDYYKLFADAGYNVVFNNTALQKIDNNKRALGLFSVNNMAKWLDRKVFPQNLKNQSNSPTGDKTDAIDQPGLKEMTLKAIDIVHQRSKKDGSGFFIMSEAASIDKMMHVLDYDRALGELLELDDTVRATLEHLKQIGEADDTLVIVTADHGHGFDVIGGVDTKFLAAQTGDRAKRNAIGVYQNSGLSGYTTSSDLPTNQTVLVGTQGPNFPARWDPRYAIAAGVVANPDHRENFTVHTNGPRLPAIDLSDGNGDVVNPVDAPNGFTVQGNIPTNEPQGVHSLTDVPVHASGPGHEMFRGVFNSIDIFFKIADALALGTDRNVTQSEH